MSRPSLFCVLAVSLGLGCSTATTDEESPDTTPAVVQDVDHATDALEDGATPRSDGEVNEGLTADSAAPEDLAGDGASAEDTGPPPNPCEMPEICDGVDNDCDGLTDEGFPGLGNPCDGPDDDFCFGGVFVCNQDPANPVLACTDGVGDPIDEYCDGEDNDCDGEVDEDYPELGQPCDGDDSDLCANGVVVCGEDLRSVACDEDPETNNVEICNGLDDDCDGVVDEEEVCEGGPNTQEAVLVLDGLDGTLYKSLDQGATWSVQSTVPGDSWPANVTMVRTGTNVIYVRVGNENIWRSDDAGLTWTEKGVWPNATYNRTICAAPKKDTVYATDATGDVYMSTTQAATFEKVGSWETQASTVGCAVGPDGALVMMDAAYLQAPTWISFDGGVTFEKRAVYGEPGGGNKVTLAIGAEGTFYAVSGDQTALRSVDQAVTWESVATIPTTVPGPGVQAIAVGFDGTVYAVTPNAGELGGQMLYSGDQAVSWSPALTDWKGTSPSSGWTDVVTVYVPIQE